MKKNKRGFMYLEILLVLAIIIFAGFKVFKAYYKSPTINKETQKIMIEQGIDTTNYKTTVDSYRDKLEDIQKKHLEDLEKIE